MSAPESIMELRRLTKIYRSGKESKKALDGISFTLGPGLLLVLSLAVAAADAVLASLASRAFTPEKLLRA